MNALRAALLEAIERFLERVAGVRQDIDGGIRDLEQHANGEES